MVNYINQTQSMKKLCYIATIPAAVHIFLRSHIQANADIYEVTVICNSTDQYLLDGINARLIILPIKRPYLKSASHESRFTPHC